MLRVSVALLALLFVSGASRAQNPEREIGRLYTETFTSEDFGETNRSSGIAQDRAGVLYAGNQNVVLAFDGQTWRSIPTDTGLNIVLARDAQDRLWVGGLAGFGRLDDDGRGGRVFTSLRDAIPASERSFGQFFGIATASHGAYFFADRDVVRAHDTGVVVLKGYRGVGVANDTLLAINRDGALDAFDGQSWHELIDAPELRRNHITRVHATADGTLLLCTRNDGLWRLGDGNLTRLVTDIDPLLREPGHHELALLRDGTIVVTLWSGPIAFLRPDGRLLHLLSRDSVGRPLPRARGILQDRAGDVWMAHANGITRIPWPAHVTLFDFAGGLPRAVIKALHRFGGRLYAGTSEGLYVLEPASLDAGFKPARFALVPGCEEQVWSFSPIGNAFVLTGPSVRIVRPGEPPVRLVASNFTLSVAVPPGREDVAVLGLSNGLQLLRRAGSTWKLEPVPGSPGASMDSLHLDANDALWIGSTNNGYFRLPSFSAVIAGTAPATVEHYPGGHGLASAALSSYPRFGLANGVAYFSDGDSIYDFDPIARSFRRRFQLPSLPGAPAPEILQFGTTGGTIWMQARLPAPHEGHWTRHQIWHPASHDFFPLPRTVFNLTGSAQAFLEEKTADGSIAWIGGDEGLARIELPAAAVTTREFKVVVRRMLDGDGLTQPLPLGQPVQFADDSVLTVEFSTDRLDDRATRFQTRLQGRDRDWSPPSRNATFNAAGLRPGDYRLQIRASDADGRMSEPAEIAWIILPPWWQTWWAFAGYAAVGLGLVAGGVRWRLCNVQRRNQELEQLVATRTHQLRDAKSAAESANHAKSAFLANMSHELRTPLNAILGYAQILRRETGLSDKGRHQLGIVGRNGEHLLQMINEVLDLAKIEAGKMTLHTAPFPLMRVVKTAADLFEQRAADKGLAFRLEIGAGLPKTVSSDEQKLRQIVFNLLGNAVKFTDRGEIVFSVTHIAAHVRFEISDTGPGIAADQLDAIFQPFHQATPAAQSHGTGLGLAISQRLAELLGGRIHVASEGGRGSRFWLDLTLPEVVEPHGHHAVIRTITGYSGARRRILVADDEPTNRAVLRDLLEPLGFTIDDVPDGAACLAAVEQNRYDCLLLDLRMPVLGGLDAVPRLRALPHGRLLPIVAVSASVLGFDQNEAIAAGCNAFLPKPVQESQLLETLGRLLRLEWTARESTAPFDSLLASSATTGLPSAAMLEALLQLARRGDVDALREQIAVALSQGEPGAAFLSELDQLAVAFRTAEIRQRLADALKRTSPSSP